MPVNPSTVNVANLDGSNGFRITGPTNDIFSGFAVSDAGDINGDGFDDLIVSSQGGFGAVNESYETTVIGSAYVIFGTNAGFGDGLGHLDLSSIDGSNGFVFTNNALDMLGYSIAAAGDINGDGFDDFIVGATQTDISANDAGAAYVVFGTGQGFPQTLTAGSLTGVNGFQISGGGTGDFLGSAVSAAGDVNGDGVDDIIVGSYGVDAGLADSGAAYVIFGSHSGFAANISIASLNGNNGFRIAGEAQDGKVGISVGGGGDFNGDGIDDLILGANRFTGTEIEEGCAYVIFGRDGGFTGNLSLSSLAASQGFQMHAEDGYDSVGISVSNAGDINGDGFTDLVVGASRAEAGGDKRGASYVVFGGTAFSGADFDLASLNGTNGFKIKGVTDHGFAGYSVSGAGDVNGDGFADLVIGSAVDDIGPNEIGSYVVFGKADGFGSTVNLAALNGTDGFKLTGVSAIDNTGNSVSGAGDINNDGFDDVVVGAWGAQGGGINRGESYVIFGRATGTLNRTFTDASEVIGGGDWDDVLRGAGGDDQMNGGLGDDLLDGGADVDTLTGGDGDDTIIGGAGGDIINGGEGDDTITCGSGNDYVFIGLGADEVSGGSGAGDTLDIQGYFAAGGTVNFLAGLAFMTGSEEVSHISGFEFVTGSDGNDTMIGNAAANALDGGNGNDTLDGGTGADTLAGGSGNDTYFVDALDTVIEATRSGIDTVNSAATFSIASLSNIERLTFTGTANTNGTGNGTGNILTGNAGVNTLDGAAGADQLIGGRGRDTLIGGTQSDRFKFAAGDSGQTAATMDRISDFTKGTVGVGDRFDFANTLAIGGSSAAATGAEASINLATGVAAFAAGSGNSMTDALNDIASRMTLSTDGVGEFALFQVGGTGVFHVFVSDGVAGVTANDVLVQLTTITSIVSINLTGGDLTILS